MACAENQNDVANNRFRWVTFYSYDEAGQANQTTDPMGYVTQATYDNASRTTQTVEDSGSGLLNRTTNWTYTLDNLVATMTAVNATTGNQTTTWTYGTNLTTSGVARNDLLASVTYPDSVSGSDVVSYTYNTQGQQVTVTDQRGTVRTFYFDKLGRQTDDCVTTVGTGTDNAVLRISTTYEVRGMVSTVTSYNNATPGSGTALNQCALAYNTFGQLTAEEQEHSGTATSSSPKVQYRYDTGASGSNEIRFKDLSYPNGRTIVSSHGVAGGMNDLLNRVDTIQDAAGPTNLASYAYLGLGAVVRIQYPEPSVWLDLWGGTSGTFNGLDLFNRIIDQRWQNGITGTPADIDRYQYGYDQDSNRLYKANVVGTPIVTGGLDEFYSYDHLNRLTEMQRGTLNSGKTGITGTPVREMDWTLDPTGNWPAYLTKTSGTTDLSQTRTSNKVNEITAIGGTPTWAAPAYDAAGNMTTMPQPATPTSSYAAVYDAWNRMVSLSASGTTVAKYQYDGRDRRIVKLSYSGGVLSETRHFYFTNSWRDIEERVGTAASMDKQYVWGVRYVDELVCRDDATPQRLYASQDANFSLTSITNTSGTVQERYLFDPYGNRAIMNASWTVITSSPYAWVLGHQGLPHEPESNLLYIRLRVMSPALGLFLRRDPAGFSRGSNLYQVVRSNPTKLKDPTGLADSLSIGPVVSIGPITSIPFPMPTPGTDLRQFTGSFINNPGWGSTGYTSGGIVSVSTTLHPLSLSPGSTCDCINSVNGFNQAALQHEQDAQTWFSQNYGDYNTAAWQARHDALFGPRSPCEINNLINMYNLLNAAYEACNPGMNDPKIQARIDGLTNLLSQLNTATTQPATQPCP